MVHEQYLTIGRSRSCLQWTRGHVLPLVLLQACTASPHNIVISKPHLCLVCPAVHQAGHLGRQRAAAVVHPVPAGPHCPVRAAEHACLQVTKAQHAASWDTSHPAVLQDSGAMQQQHSGALSVLVPTRAVKHFAVCWKDVQQAAVSPQCKRAWRDWRPQRRSLLWLATEACAATGLLAWNVSCRRVITPIAYMQPSSISIGHDNVTIACRCRMRCTSVPDLHEVHAQQAVRPTSWLNDSCIRTSVQYHFGCESWNHITTDVLAPLAFGPRQSLIPRLQCTLYLPEMSLAPTTR